jgi:hypothetical protein
MSKLPIHYDIPSSPVEHKDGENWNTPKRSRVRQMERDGNSWSTISHNSGFPSPLHNVFAKINQAKQLEKESNIIEDLLTSE